MFRSIIFVALVSVSAAACAPPTRGPDAPLVLGSVVRDQRTAIEDLRFNTCNGESVYLTGEVHVVITEHRSARRAHINGHLTGTGSAGNDYVLNLQAQVAVQAGSESVELTGRELLISKGGAPNQVTTVRITSDPFSIVVTADCRG